MIRYLKQRKIKTLQLMERVRMNFYRNRGKPVDTDLLHFMNKAGLESVAIFFHCARLIILMKIYEAMPTWAVWPGAIILLYYTVILLALLYLKVPSPQPGDQPPGSNT